MIVVFGQMVDTLSNYCDLSISISPYDKKRFIFFKYATIFQHKRYISFLVFNKFELLISQGSAAIYLMCDGKYYIILLEILQL